jgi:hypothetical protein
MKHTARTTPAYTIRSIRLRGQGGRWGMVHLIYADGRQVATAGTIQQAHRLIRQLLAVR